MSWFGCLAVLREVMMDDWLDTVDVLAVTDVLTV